MENTAAILPTSDLELSPRQVDKEKFLLGYVSMPGSPDLKEGERNRLKVCVRYMKDGMHRQGRGIYLTMTGHTTDGTFERHLLMQDPSLYLLIEPAKRFSAKRLAEVAEGAPVTLRDTLDEQVARARAYYESKGAKP